MRAGRFKNSRKFVNVILTPRDRERLQQFLERRGQEASPFIRGLILRELELANVQDARKQAESLRA